MRAEHDGGGRTSTLTSPSCSTQHSTAASTTVAAETPSTTLRTTLASLAVDKEGREVIVLDLEVQDQVSAKQLITRLSEEFGLTLDAVNFIPEQQFSTPKEVIPWPRLSVESKVAPPPCPVRNAVACCRPVWAKSSATSATHGSESTTMRHDASGEKRKSTPTARKCW